MRSRLKRSLATTLALLMYVQPLTQSAYGAYSAKGAYSALVPTGAGASLRSNSTKSTLGTNSSIGTSAPYAPYAPYALYAPNNVVPLPAELVQAGQVVIFGPNTYSRTTGQPNTYDASFTRPAWTVGPFTMHVANGTSAGLNRLSSSEIVLNDTTVASPSDFAQSVAAFDKTVSLQANNTMQIRVTSVPLGFMTVSIVAHNGDHTPPSIAFVSPVSGGFSNTDTTQIVFRATDLAGSGDAGASGVLASTLSAAVDGVNQTSLFALINGDFVGNVPALPEGAHTVSVNIADLAGNTASASLSFTIDRTPPQLVVVDPAENQFTNAHAIAVHGGVVDATATTVTVDGAPATVANGEFTALGVPLGAGPTQTITLSATDAAGNLGTTSRTVRIDRDAPALAFTSPVPGAALAGPRIAVSGTVTDANTVFVTVNDETMTVSGATFAGLVPLPDGARTLIARAHDLAGNESTVQLSLLVDSEPPVIQITEPEPDAISNQSSIVVRGTATDTLSAVTVRAGGQDVTPVNGVFEVTLPLHSEGGNTLIVTATDAAGNEAMSGVNVTADRTAPQVTITSPTRDVIGTLPLTLQGTVQDNLTTVTVRVNGVIAAVSGLAWTATIPTLEEGPQTIAVEASDDAGNSTTLSRSLLIDLTAPLLTITAPQGGTTTADGSIAVSGTVEDISVSEVLVNGMVATFAPASGTTRAFSATASLAEGENAIVVSATDAADHATTAQVTVTRDATPPSVALTVGAKVTRARPAAASIVATDNLALDRVTISVDGTLVQTLTTPPFALNISAPEGARAGDVLTVVATAFDRVGNSAQSTALLPVASDGAVAGQVLSDVTGRTLDAAVVTIDGVAPIVTTDGGRYSFATSETRISLNASSEGMTSVDRAFDIVSEAGTVALDARLTPLAPATSVGAGATTIAVSQSGAAATSTTLSIVVPPGAFSDGESLRATSLSGQGLPGLLPLGWSPIAALDLRGAVPASALTLEAGTAGTQPYLARYVNRTWQLASGALTPDANGSVSVALPVADAIAVALVIPDPGVGGPAVPAIGDPLPGADSAPIPLTATSAGVLDPPVLSPGGGTSIGTLTVTSPTPLPSGTIVQAVVSETFSLANGDTISTDARNQDFVLYRTFGTQQNQTPGTLGTSFPVSPSRSFTTAELVSGLVHLDILAGREAVRGQAGGSGAVTLSTTGATLSIAQDALTEDVPIAFQSAILSSFLPATADVSPMREFSVDFSGRTLSSGAEMAVLASQLTGVGPDDAVVLVRVESIEGRTRLVPVAIGELSGDRYIARASHGLLGVTRGGRHIWYRVAAGVGFVRGVIDANGTPLTATVEVAGLPFASLSDPTTGQYTVVARPGTATLRARAPGTSLAAEASIAVMLNTDATLDITLNGEVSAASIAPANGAIAVLPAIQVEVTSPVSIRSHSLATATIAFERTSDPAGAVPYRLVLSGSGRTLAIVPLARLADDATYSVIVSGLTDVVGGAIIVPATSFTTQSTTSPVYNLDQLVFTFPDDEGLVTLNAPANTLVPGSAILIVNESSGEVSTLGVNNDGSVSDVGGKFIAHIADRLIVTITDPQGRVTTFKRSEYVAADGTTAVGNGGGEILGAGGVEVRIPEDAVMNGVAAILKIAAIAIDQLPEGPLPDLPGATVATALKMDSPDPPSFNKEVDLAFPKPADAPDNAVFFVYRRLDGPDGQVAYESIDYADVEGEGATAKVVTKSYPFSGYVSSINGYSASGLDFGGAVGNQFTNYAILMFAYDQASPGRKLGGVITGKVLRVKWAPGSTTPTYEPVKGALVSGVDAGGQPVYATAPVGGQPPTVAVSQADGTYSLFDRQFTGGAVTISATVDNDTKTATAYEVDPQNAKSPGLRFAKNVATANVTFPAIAPLAPASPVQVSVLTLDTNGVRKASNGIVVVGEQIVIGIKAGGNTVQRVTVQSGSQSAEYGVRVDPQAPQAGSFEVIAENSLPFATPGSYTITAIALSPDAGVVTGALVVRAVAPGGSNNDALPNDPPAVITALTVPKANATSVQIGALPLIVFTEPVKNVPGSVTLTEVGFGTIGVMLSGVGPNGPIAELTPASIVTSITIQPSAGLKYGATYTLTLSSDIVDTDVAPNPNKPLTPYTTTFTTFAPESIGQTEELFTAGGMTVIGDRAYIATPQSTGRWFTSLRLFDVSDPTSPLEIAGNEPSGSQVFQAPPAFFLGLPVDVVSQDASPLTGGPVVAVAVTPLAYPYHSSHVRLYDVSNDQQWKWIGAVSLGRDPSDGMIRRIEIKDSMLYAVTAGIGKGIQFVDLNAVQGTFDEVLAAGDRSAAYWQMQGQLNSTEGFAQETIVNTVPVNTGTGTNSQLWDLAVTDLAINGITQTAVVATGRSPLVIANQTDGLIYNGEITNGLGGPAQTGWGYGVAAGTVAGKPIAVVSAVGVEGAPVSGPHVLAVVDLSNPAAPRALALLPLPGFAGATQDVVLRDSNVFIGTNTGTYLVSVAEPGNPRFVGTIPGVQGRLGFSNDSILIGTRRGLTEVTNPEGGIKTAALGGPLLFISQIPPQLTKVVESPGLGGGGEQLSPMYEAFTKAVPVRIVAIGLDAIKTGGLRLMHNGVAVAEQVVSFVSSRAETAIAAGTSFVRGTSLSVDASVASPDGLVVSPPRLIPAGSAHLLIDANNDTEVNDDDLTPIAQKKRWAFWEAASSIVTDANDLQDFATIKISSRVPVARLKLRLWGSSSQTRWSLTPKSGSKIAYLDDASVSDSQRVNTRSVFTCDSVLVNTIVNLCDSDSNGWITIRNFPPTTKEFLIRCHLCPNDPDRAFELASEDPQTLELVSLDKAQVDIRPLREWISIQTVRRTSGMRPRTAAIPEADWPTGIRPDAKTLTVLLHGFNVSAAGAVDFFTTYTKRLYWAGHPVLLPQRGSPQVVGFSWPGDQGVGKLFLPIVSNLLFFPEDEFGALQTGKVFADWIEQMAVADTAQPRSIDVIAHSLGNMVVNSGLKFLPAGAIKTYLMNEAAVPSEAFNAAAPAAPGLDSSAAAYGYPDDQKWEQSWQQIIANRTKPLSEAACDVGTLPKDCWSLYDYWRDAIGSDKTEDQLRVTYTYRWRQARPAVWDPDRLPEGPLPQRGPWAGFFADNLGKATVINTFNRGDFILGSNVWQASQRLQKPNIGPFGVFSELESPLFWAKLDNTSEEELVVFNGISPAHANVVRQWAELAHWFPAVSYAAGSTETISNHLDFTGRAPGGGFNPVISHGYLGGLKITEALQFFRQIKQALGR